MLFLIFKVHYLRYSQFQIFLILFFYWFDYSVIICEETINLIAFLKILNVFTFWFELFFLRYLTTSIFLLILIITYYNPNLLIITYFYVFVKFFFLAISIQSKSIISEVRMDALFDRILRIMHPYDCISFDN